MMAEDAADGAADDGGICRWLQQMIWRRVLLLMTLCTDSERLSCIRNGGPFGPRMWTMMLVCQWQYDSVSRITYDSWGITIISLYVCKRTTLFSFVSMLYLLIYDRKMIWLGLVWLLYPYAMVPYIYKSIHPIKLQVIHLLKKDISEPGIRVSSLRDRTLGTNMVAHPMRIWPLTPSNPLKRATDQGDGLTDAAFPIHRRHHPYL